MNVRGSIQRPGYLVLLLMVCGTAAAAGPMPVDSGATVETFGSTVGPREGMGAEYELYWAKACAVPAFTAGLSLFGLDQAAWFRTQGVSCRLDQETPLHPLYFGNSVGFGGSRPAQREEGAVASSTPVAFSADMMLQIGSVTSLRFAVGEAVEQTAGPAPEPVVLGEVSRIDVARPSSEEGYVSFATGSPPPSGVVTVRRETSHPRPFQPAPAEAASQHVGAGGRLDLLAEHKEVFLGGAILAFAAIALYQRITPATSFDHERRAAIHRALSEWPDGATAGDVARRLNMNRKTVDYHLTYLARLSKVKTGIDETGTRRYSLRPLPDRKPLVERVLGFVRERPGISIVELSEALGVSRSAADRHAKALVIQGVLESRLVEGERRLYSPA